MEVILGSATNNMKHEKVASNMSPAERSNRARPLVQRTKIIHALDVEDLDKALAIGKAHEPFVDSIKISYPLVLRNGPEAIERFKETVGLPILTCFKVADIPPISSRIMKATLDAGADGVTLHGFVGR